MAGLEIATTKAVAEAALDLIDKARKQGWFDKLIDALRKKHRVLVLGATGTGKTVFLESLTEVVPKAIDMMNRTEFVEKYHIRISRQPFIFIVVSYGYLESRAIEKPEIKINGKVSEAFLKEQRQLEIDMLDEWIPLLGGAESAGWLITVVTKADLWWRQRDKVLTHYETGPYYEALGEAQLLKPVVLPYCSIFQMFYEEVAMSGDFEDADRIQAKSQMIRTLLAAIGKERHA
jgi:energy-coupling factor transporter ATP-binding protein EcfA2